MEKTEMRYFTKFQISLVALILISSCSTRTSSFSKFNPPGNQTPKFTLSDFKSPENRSNDQRKDLSVVVTISGGGHRAGNFGVGVLKALENISCKDKTINLLKEIDYFSTVSGGGFAAGSYISTLYDHLSSGSNFDSFSFSSIIENDETGVSRNLERGYHNILLKALANVRSIGMLDRGDFLERQFDWKILGAKKRGKSIKLKEILIPVESESTVKLPIWVANASIYENGGIFPFIPSTFERYGVKSYTHHLKKVTASDGNLFSKAEIGDIPLSIGLKASASFPNVVPATTLESSYDPLNQYIHLFDGGLSDNLGIITGLKILLENQNPYKLLIVIDAYKGQFEPFSDQEGSPTMLEISLKTTVISLDAFRSRHHWTINQIKESKNNEGGPIHVVYLNFDDLPENIFKRVKDIGTAFNISAEQQDELFEAGKVIVKKHEQDLLTAFLKDDCGN
jgi:hypothetical protein